MSNWSRGFSSADAGPLVEDRSVEIRGDVGQSEFDLGPRETDRPNEETEAVLPMGEDMPDPRRSDDFTAFARATACGIAFPAGLRR